MFLTFSECRLQTIKVQCHLILNKVCGRYSTNVFLLPSCSNVQPGAFWRAYPCKNLQRISFHPQRKNQVHILAFTYGGRLQFVLPFDMTKRKCHIHSLITSSLSAAKDNINFDLAKIVACRKFHEKYMPRKSKKQNVVVVLSLSIFVTFVCLLIAAKSQNIQQKEPVNSTQPGCVQVGRISLSVQHFEIKFPVKHLVVARETNNPCGRSGSLPFEFG